jgi:H+/Cl- antiporter ClcA
MTASDTMQLPLMATAILANGVSRWICPTPIYRALSEGFLNSLHLEKDKAEKS